MEKLLSYEYDCPYRFNDETRERLMMEVAGEDFESQPLPGRMVLDDLEQIVREHKVDIRTPQGFALLRDQVGSTCLNADAAVEGLRRFCWVEPRLPDAAAKRFKRGQPALSLEPTMGRDAIIARLEELRNQNQFAELAFYAYRDLNRTEPEPFLRAAFERCPVSIAASSHMSDEAVLWHIDAMPDRSIYDGPGRLAQPDEVWNYGRGDGAEKAVLVANILRARRPGARTFLDIGGEPGSGQVTGHVGETTFGFMTGKGLRQQTWEYEPAG